MTDPPELPTISTVGPADRSALELGAFSVSLSVADLERSLRFYEALGFEAAGGDADAGYLILKNGRCIIGLFHGVFDGNILTFNPGLTNGMERVESFTDVREIQERLRGAGIEPSEPIGADDTEGPASITVVDPDGNPVLIDQFF